MREKHPRTRQTTHTHTHTNTHTHTQFNYFCIYLQIEAKGKSFEEKEMKLATIAITKSRIGRDGIVFENCKFDNELMEIDTESSVTFLGLEEQKEERNRNRVNELLAKRKQQQTIN